MTSTEDITPQADGPDSPELQAWMERRFITLVSHQLKSPLVAVRQYLDLLQEDAANRPDAEDARRWLDRSVVRLDEALSIVEDWLLLSRVEAGALCRKDVSSDLAEVLDQLVADSQEAAAARKVQVAPPQCPRPLLVKGDRNSLVAALSHIVDNAILYNRDGGSVTISAQVDQGQEPPLARVEVCDTGIGIPSAFLPQLFSEFQRARSKASRDVPGTGLGLAISSHIVRELGGRIAVESTEGRGSAFTVTFLLA